MTEPSTTAARYAIDRDGSRIRFEIRLMAWKVQGTFTDVEGWIDYDENHPEAMIAEASIRVASIQTREKRRDEHLRSPDFFDAGQFPVMRFVGRRATDLGRGVLRMEGDLAIRDATRPVSFEVRDLVSGRDGSARGSLRFRATTRINRLDYGVGGRSLLDQGGIMVGREVEVNLQVLALQGG
jgi:polyisoprenoid-binding protein YceI